MNKLKELRTRAGMTQKELAKKLQTTQQTVARWESEHTAIPSATLKEIAALFGSSVDELLGVERRRPRRNVAEQGEARLHDPWGTLTIDFAFGSRTYPIDYNNGNFLVSYLSEEGSLTGAEVWWENFDTLDNRCVFFNLAAVRKLRFIGPDVDHPILPAGIRWRGPRVKHDDDHPQEEPHKTLSNVSVTDVGGVTFNFPLNDANGRHLALLDNVLHKVEANGYLPISEESGALQILNLSSVAAIEIPREAYYAWYHAPEICTFPLDATPAS